MVMAQLVGRSARALGVAALTIPGLSCMDPHLPDTPEGRACVHECEHVENACRERCNVDVDGKCGRICRQAFWVCSLEMCRTPEGRACASECERATYDCSPGCDVGDGGCGGACKRGIYECVNACHR